MDCAIGRQWTAVVENHKDNSLAVLLTFRIRPNGRFKLEATIIHSHDESQFACFLMRPSTPYFRAL